MARSLQGCPRHGGVEPFAPDQDGPLTGKVDRARNHVALRTRCCAKWSQHRVSPFFKGIGGRLAHRQGRARWAEGDFQIRSQVVGLEIAGECKRHCGAALMDPETTTNGRFCRPKDALRRCRTNQLDGRRGCGSCGFGRQGSVNSADRAGHEGKNPQNNAGLQRTRLDDHGEEGLNGEEWIWRAVRRASSTGLPAASPNGLVMRTPWQQVMGPVAIFIVLRGLDNTVLKLLQLHGASNPVNGVNPVSFCNVFFFVQLISGVTFLFIGRRDLSEQIASLDRNDRYLLMSDAFLGRFLGPVAYFFSLNALSVITQTLLFALTLPVSALMARWILRERLPKAFTTSVLLISSGLLLHQLSQMATIGQQTNLVGVGWALVGVMAFSGAALTGRTIAGRHLTASLSIGVGATASALVFGLLAILMFGPEHFLLLQIWWVLGVLLLYSLTLSLGSEVALRMAYRQASVATVSLLGSLSIVVAVTSAALLLNETIHPGTIIGVMLLVAGVMLSKKTTNPNRLLGGK